MKTNKKQILCGVASFFMPVFIMTLVYALIGIFPFGDKSLLSIDMNGQYISFFSYLKSVLLGQESLFYSFSKTIGGNLSGFSSYYLLSPLNWIVIFFESADLTQAVLFITLMKVGLSGLTMNFFLKDKASSLQSLLFSNVYALMAYNLVYQQNIMWLDGVLLFPLVMLGIEKIINQKKISLYIISLFLTISINYYIGFMVCIFSVIYYFYNVLIAENFKIDIKRFSLFAWASLLAGGMSCVVVVPTVFSLANGKFGAVAEQLQTPTTAYNIFELPSKLFMGSFNASEYAGQLPNIFCGCIVLVFIAMFFLNSKFSIKEKMITLSIFAFLFLSTYINELNKLWHGLSLPVWFPARFSFIISFFMIIVASKAFKETNIKKFFAKLSVFILCFAGMAVVAMKKSSQIISTKDVLISFLFVLLCGVCFYLYKKSSKKILSISLVLIVCLDLFTNGYLLLHQVNYKSESVFSDFVEEKSQIINQIKNDDNSFYRMESVEYNYSRNDPMLFGYKGMSHYSSAESVKTTSFLESLGYHTHRKIWSYYDFGNTVVTDSLFGVKYILSNQEFYKNYEMINSYGDINVYKNDYSLSLGYVVNEDILKTNLSENAFEIQNNILINSTALNEKVFVKENQISMSTENLKINSDYNFEKINEDNEAFVEFEVKINSENDLYFYAPTQKIDEIKLYVNDEFCYDYFSEAHHSAINLGKFNVGQTISLKMTLQNNLLSFKEPLFYYENLEVFQEHYKEIAKSQIIIDENYSSVNIPAKVTSEKDGYLLFTIPYDEGWKVEIDGEKAEIYCVLDALIMTKITKGEHELVLKYQPKGLVLGAIISIVSLFLFILFLIFSKKSFKTKNI